MNATEIKEVFKAFQVSLSKEDVWSVQGTWVIKHSALERLAAKAGVYFDDPEIIKNEANEIVLFLRGYRKLNLTDTVSDWSFGETSMGKEGANYRVSGKMAAYPWAMTEKRVKDRLIIKLAGLHGLYSEDEADDFKVSANKKFSADVETEVEAQPGKPEVVASVGEEAQEASEPVQEKPADKPQTAKKSSETANDSPYDKLTEEQKEVIDRLDHASSIPEVMELMMTDSVQTILKASNKVDEVLLRAHGKKRLKELGWLSKKPTEGGGSEDAK